MNPLTLTTPLHTPIDGAAHRKRRRIIWAAKQAAIMLIAVAAIALLAFSVRAGLAKNGIGFDMVFLGQTANFDISEGYALTWDGLRQFVSSDTNAQALFAGFFNTVKTSVASILVATVLGLLVGMGRVSHNWLVRQLSFGFVELVRNTPLLIQLVFWYFAVILKMPGLTEASTWFNAVIVSQQGVFIPGLTLAADASIWSIWAVLMGTVFLVAGIASRKMRSVYVGISLAGWLGAVLLGLPFSVSFPHVQGFGVVGGWSSSPEFAALLLGLSVYTAAFIAEIIRGAILALPNGQWEAAAALGLSRRYAFRDIVVPQVFRVVLPAFGNQYISLAKTTSLGIAIGFSDLFNVYGTVANTSGRNLEGVLVVMLAYLVLSWTISGAVNLANRQMLRAGGAMTHQIWRWCRRNLFATPFDTSLSAIFIPLAFWAVATVAYWAISQAQWHVVADNLRVLMVGTYPADLMLRPWISTVILSALCGATMGAVVSPKPRRTLFALCVCVIASIGAAASGHAGVSWSFASLAIGLACWLGAGNAEIVRRLLGAGWLVGLFAIGVLLSAASVERWGGLLMGVVFTLLASLLSVPLGIGLALGRRSKYASARVLCTGYIEVMRSLPLILIVYWVWIISPLIAPEHPVPDLIRGLIGFTFFFAAYVAEYVRSGLQAIPRGQVEAAESLGMAPSSINRDIVLPQAIRVVMPGLVGNVLDIFNNVPLLFIIGLTDFLRAGQMVLVNPQSGNRTYELYAFMFVVYLAVASLITYGARRLETRMALGHR